jgi:hypothetical protein
MTPSHEWAYSLRQSLLDDVILSGREAVKDLARIGRSLVDRLLRIPTMLFHSALNPSPG